ncbi:unnamed protein product [Leptidea sinapis]|uniref:Uncharacterized protein n=1 Tax=Leptidea sinapis TaxID=189913 RepID=A0A5E4QLN4_9NEOP|nr:unnamed protein product [Leptidea sinapis]
MEKTIFETSFFRIESWAFFHVARAEFCSVFQEQSMILPASRAYSNKAETSAIRLHSSAAYFLVAAATAPHESPLTAGTSGYRATVRLSNPGTDIGGSADVPLEPILNFTRPPGCQFMKSSAVLIPKYNLLALERVTIAWARMLSGRAHLVSINALSTTMSMQMQVNPKMSSTTLAIVSLRYTPSPFNPKHK